MKKTQELLSYLITFAIIPTLWGETPSFDSLVALIESGKTNELCSIIKSNPDAVHLQNQNNLPLIHRAAMSDKHDSVAVLLDAGAKLDERDNQARTPLHVAAGWSTVEMVKLMWRRGSDPNAKTDQGLTPLDFAMNNFYQDKKIEREKIVEFLQGQGSKMSEGEMERQAVIKEVQADIAAQPDKGQQPKQDELEGAVEIVQQYVKEKTQDPASKFQEWSKVTSLGDKWTVRAKFQYKTSAGILRQDDRWFYIRDGKVISTKPAHD